MSSNKDTDQHFEEYGWKIAGKKEKKFGVPAGTRGGTPGELRYGDPVARQQQQQTNNSTKPGKDTATDVDKPSPDDHLEQSDAPNTVPHTDSSMAAQLRASLPFGGIAAREQKRTLSVPDTTTTPTLAKSKHQDFVDLVSSPLSIRPTLSKVSGALLAADTQLIPSSPPPQLPLRSFETGDDGWKTALAPVHDDDN